VTLTKMSIYCDAWAVLQTKVKGFISAGRLDGDPRYDLLSAITKATRRHVVNSYGMPYPGYIADNDQTTCMVD